MDLQKLREHRRELEKMTKAERDAFIREIREKGPRSNKPMTTFVPRSKARQRALTRVGFGPREEVKKVPC